jgi:excisionase family DNA binding protein
VSQLTMAHDSAAFPGGWRTVSEAAHYTRLSRSTLYQLMTDGRLPYTTVGRRRLIPAKALDDLCSANLVNTAATAGE